MVQIIDLSVPIVDMAAGEPVIPGRSPPTIEYLKHADTTPFVESFFNVKREQLPRKHGWASEVLRLSTHAGTHCDAPYHYSPTTEGGSVPSMKIDEVPLDWYYGDGVILDFSHKRKAEPIVAADVEDALAKIEYTVKARDIVLFRTDAYKLWPTGAYQSDFPGVTREAAEYLLDRGVRVMGVDAYNFDMPFDAQKKSYAETGDNRFLEPCHWALGYDRNYSHIEKLANLDKVPVAFGFTFAAFPVKIQAASAGWCRAVAILNGRP
jgi:kynurenine formamidase